MLLFRFLVEGKRIIKKKRYIAFFILFLTVGTFFITSGVIEYKKLLEEKDQFISNERIKRNLMITYDPNIIYGFRVLYLPSPLNVFFNNSSIYENLYSNGDITEDLNINSSFKGRDLLQKGGYINDLGGLFFLLGSLFFMHMGITSYKCDKTFFKFSNTIIRLSLLNIILVVFIYWFFKIPGFYGLEFTSADRKFFFDFSLYLICFLDFFYAIGLTIRSFTSDRKIVYIYALTFWFISISVIPEMMNIYLHKKAESILTNAKYNQMKLKEDLKFEEEVKNSSGSLKPLSQRNKLYQKKLKDLLQARYRNILNFENQLNQEVQTIVEEYEKVLIFFPTGFYNYLSSEGSGKGYQGYIGLVDYTMKLRREILDQYLKVSPEHQYNNVEPFDQKDKNIFYAQNFLPHSFFTALVIILLYTVLLFEVSYFKLAKRKAKVSLRQIPDYNFRKGNTYFILCKDDKYRENLFRYYETQGDASVIDRVNVEDIDLGVDLPLMIRYFCKLSGVPEESAWDNLRQLGLKRLNSKFKGWGKSGKTIPEETIFKIYCAVSTAGNNKIIIINDFLKGKSREMEHDFLKFVNDLNDAGKIVIYLSCDIFLASLPNKGKMNIESYKNFKIDPGAVSLR